MITIVDYISHSDESNKPMGHPIKVINEAIDLLVPFTSVEVAASKNHIGEVKNTDRIKLKELPYHINAFSEDKMGNLIKKWKNLRELFRSQIGIKWFINVDFSMFLYLFLFGSKKNKIWITLCYNPLKDLVVWKKKIIIHVLNKADLIIVTNKNFLKAVPGNVVFIPDYYYKEELYRKYQCSSKKNQVVCLGTMGETKQLEDLVEVAKSLSIPVIIKGNFAHDIERFNRLKKQAEGYKNIFVENKYVGNDEYYKTISESEYVILPYDMTLYDERTSGILLETVFLRSVPVAPNKLLEYNNIEGIGYDLMSELESRLVNPIVTDIIIEKNDVFVKKNFSEKAIMSRLIKEL